MIEAKGINKIDQQFYDELFGPNQNIAQLEIVFERN